MALAASQSIWQPSHDARRLSAAKASARSSSYGRVDRDSLEVDRLPRAIAGASPTLAFSDDQWQ